MIILNPSHKTYENVCDDRKKEMRVVTKRIIFFHENVYMEMNKREHTHSGRIPNVVRRMMMHREGPRLLEFCRVSMIRIGSHMARLTRIN